MRTLVFIAVLTFPACCWSQWVEFEACGLMDWTEQKDIYERFQGEARIIGPYRVWVPAITHVKGFRAEAVEIIACTGIYTAAGPILVIGTLEEVMRKIREARQ